VSRVLLCLDCRRRRRLAAEQVHVARLAELQAAAPGVELLVAADAAAAVTLAASADAVLGLCTPELLAAGPGIRWIQAYSAGVERCVAIPALRERGVLLTNMQRVAGPVMAEHVLAKFFAAVKPGAFFVNVGRGRSVVQAALVAALKSGRLAGAGLDVTDPEPLPADSPLWQMQNVILTPHVSANSDVDDGVRFAIAWENLRRYVAGDKLLSVVDLAPGY
jgi:phosphoglycerate dehydrogenase-like enzyme